MSAQMVEILILALIAFLIISKLLSVLGTTDEDDPAKKKAGSFFGEPRGLKDVTGSVVEPANSGSKVIPLHANIIFSADAKVNDIIRQIVEKMPDFNPDKFLKGAKGAFKMVLEALSKNDEKALAELVDKRFSIELGNKAAHYNKAAISDVTAAFEDAYSFGNSIYVKVVMSGKKFKEFWVFTKNIHDAGPAWQLSNIEV